MGDLTLTAPGPPSSRSNPPSNSRGTEGLSGYTLPMTQQRPTAVAMKVAIWASPLPGETQVYS